MSEVKPDAAIRVPFLSMPQPRAAGRICAAGNGRCIAVYMYSLLGMDGSGRRWTNGSRMADHQNAQFMEVTGWL